MNLASVNPTTSVSSKKNPQSKGVSPLSEILSTYDINPSTLSLLPAPNIEYDTVVYEPDRIFHVKQTPLQIIKKACLENGASYEGRRASVIHLTASKQKVPIPVSICKHIYVFPNASPSQFLCRWIFYHHVSSIKSKSQNGNDQSIITFKNGQQLPMQESLNLLEKQMYRTAMCIAHFSSQPNQRITRFI